MMQTRRVLHSYSADILLWEDERERKRRKKALPRFTFSCTTQLVDQRRVCVCVCVLLGTEKNIDAIQ